MDQDILDYLHGERICVIALQMPDGTPHAATVHYAHTDDPFTFMFKTDKTYRKSEALFGKESVRASLVVGTSEGDMKTFQADGTASLFEGGPLKEAYLTKFPEKAAKEDGPNAIYFSFTPTWWRFTDWTGPKGKQIRTS